MNRLKANRKILSILSAIVEQHPDWRFHQILQNVGVNIRDVTECKCLDQFYEESDDTLDRIKQMVI
jgi:hypothetical protein